MAIPTNMQIVNIYFTVLFVIFVFILIHLIVYQRSNESDSQIIRWGKPFPSPLHSNMTDNSCSYNNHSVCCALIEPHINPNIYPRKHDELLGKLRASNCEVIREYIPSPYEQAHIAKAKEIDKLITEEERREALAQFIFDDLPHVPIWLDRIKVHMSPIPFPTSTPTSSSSSSSSSSYHLKGTGHGPRNKHAAAASVTTAVTVTITEDDLEYLSRYKLTRICDLDVARAYSWYEWIEPITIHARHPYSLLTCMNATRTIILPKKKKHHSLNPSQPVTVRYQNQSYTLTTLDSASFAMINPDYVLLQSSRGYEDSVRYHPGRRHHVTRRYLFDIGSSTFLSSLNWFLCAYLQKGMDFDQIYAWEATLLEPHAFWKQVPPRILPWLHFFNLPVNYTTTATTATANTTAAANRMNNSSLVHAAQDAFQVLSQIAREEDFVAVKLDVDLFRIEIPMVLQLLQQQQAATSTSLGKLVDEFFFELHFRCEFLMYCGWGEEMPTEYEGLVLDRSHALVLFQQLRQTGIRAHIWP